MLAANRAPARRRGSWTSALAGVLLWNAQLAAQGQGWKFLVFSDSQDASSPNGVNTTLLAELARVVTNEKPAFVLFAGDNSAYGSQSAFETWTNILSPVYAAGIPVYTTVGNHDVLDLPAYLNVLGPLLPDNGPASELKLTYAVRYSNALVLVLSTFTPGNESRGNQGWIDAVLATNTLPHVFVMGHSLAFRMYHTDSLGDYPADRDVFWNSLSNAHCRIYFCGHDHFYDHARLDDQDANPENDVHQIIAGPAAAVLYPDVPYGGTNDAWTPLRVWHEQEYGYVTVEIEGERVTATRHRRVAEGVYEPTDVFAYSVLPTPKLWSRYRGGVLTLSWPGKGTLQSAAGPVGNFVDVPEAVSPHTITNASDRQRFYRVHWR